MTSPAVVAAAAAANSQKTLGSRRCELEGRDLGCSAASVGSVEADSSRLSIGSPMLRRTRSSTSNATAPGMISTAIAGQIAPVAAATAATRSGPATAPA